MMSGWYLSTISHATKKHKVERPELGRDPCNRAENSAVGQKVRERFYTTGREWCDVPATRHICCWRLLRNTDVSRLPRLFDDFKRTFGSLARLKRQLRGTKRPIGCSVRRQGVVDTHERGT